MADPHRIVYPSIVAGSIVGGSVVVTGGDLRAQVIAALFGASEQGALYDPSDLTTLFQDSAGTTPVTADGQPDGLALDLSQGGLGSLGSELVSNGTFDSDITGWTNFDAARGTISWNAGRIKLTTASSSAEYRVLASSPFTTVVGKTYFVKCDILQGTSVISRVFIGNSPGSGIAGASNGTTTVDELGATIVFKATATTTYVQIQILDNNANKTAEFDNVTVKELPGYHAVQGTAAARPLYDLTGGIHSVVHDLVDDALVVTLPDLGTDATVKYVTSGGITTLTNQTISGAYTLPQATWQGMIVYEGPMSTAQANAADAWLNAKAGL